LGDFKQRSANPVAIANADLTVGQSLYREVFAELPEGEIVPIQFTFPVAIRLDLVDKHRALLASVTGQIPLGIAINVEPPHQTTPLDWFLPY
jgi:hypothetical protein